MELTETATVQGQAPSPDTNKNFELSPFANPLTHYITNLITTRTVKDVYSLLNHFPSEAGLDSYVKLVINTLEAKGTIKINRGEFELPGGFIYKINKKDQTDMFPVLMQILTNRVMKDVGTPRISQAKEKLLTYCFPNNPETNARLTQIMIHLEKDLDELGASTEGKPSGGGVRMVNFINALPTAEDFSV